MWPLLLLQAALATGITHEEVPCPLDGAPVRRFHKISANSNGGYDSDLVSYSTLGQFRTHAISTCPVDLYSVYGDDIAQALSEEQRATVEAGLTKARASLVDPDNPEIWERYLIAAQVYTSLGRDPLEVAQIYVEGSWTVRDAAVGVYVGGLNGPQAAKMILSAGEGELLKPLSAENRKTVLYSMARVAHRAGYGDQRKRYLDQFLAVDGITTLERDSAARFSRLAREVEPALQDQAIAAYRRGLESKALDLLERAHATYMLADLLRRRGQYAEALERYQEVVGIEGTPAGMLDMARFFVEELKG